MIDRTATSRAETPVDAIAAVGSFSVLRQRARTLECFCGDDSVSGMSSAANPSAIGTAAMNRGDRRGAAGISDLPAKAASFEAQLLSPFAPQAASSREVSIGRDQTTAN